MKKEITIRPDGTKRIQIIIPPESKTQQQFKDEVDINRIMKKYQQGIPITHIARTPGFYGDFTKITDFNSAMSAISNAEHSFMQLPSSLRKRFGNDPAQLLEFLSDSKNLDEAVKLGLMTKPAEKSNANDDSTTNAPISKPKSKKPPTPPSESEE